MNSLPFYEKELEKLFLEHVFEQKMKRLFQVSYSQITYYTQLGHRCKKEFTLKKLEPSTGILAL